MKTKVWKHHIADNFINGICDTHVSAAALSTVFVDYDSMLLYLYKTKKDWYIAELEVDETEIEMYKNGYMATLLVDKKPSVEFRSIKIEEIDE